MGIDSYEQIQSSNIEMAQNNNNYSNSNKTKNNKNNNNQNINLNSSFNGFCGNFSSNDILYNKKKTEIDLTTTYSSAKGTYTKESYKLFSPNEKNFFYLVQKNNISGIRYLIIQGVNINILDEERTSPLHIACKESSIQTIEEIIFLGSMINIPDLVGWTPLHMACYYNRPDVVLLLLKSGANYNTHNRDKLSARDLAIKCGNYNCAKVLDNFIQYQKIEKEKCLNEINSKNNLKKEKNENENMEQEQGDIYEEILQKYILYQNLKREFLQGNEDFLSNNEDINSAKNENEDNEMSDIVNDEYYPTAEIQKKNNVENIELHEIEKCLNSLNLQISKNKEKDNEEIKNKYDSFLSKYKFIPKKHKFYLKYEYKNGKFMVKSKNKINAYENEFDIRKPKFSNFINKNQNKELHKNCNINKSFIHIHPIPSIIPTKNLNNLKIKSYSKNCLNEKNNNINNEQHKINSEEEKKQSEEEAKLYKPYNYYDEEAEEENNNIVDDLNKQQEDINMNLDLFLSEFNKKDSKNSSSNKKKKTQNKDNNSYNDSNDSSSNKSNDEEEDEDKTISLEEENINFYCENINTGNNHNCHAQKILLAPFEINRTPNNNIVNYFLEHNDIYEEILQILFHFDYVFALQFLMSISDIDNNITSLISYISSNIFNSRLRLEILNLMIYKNESTILESYFSLINTEINSIFHSIKKIFKIFDLTTNDIKLIDQLSFSFSKIYYEYNKENCFKYFKNQNAIYFFVFSFMITQLTFNQNLSNEKFDKEKIICDFIIMLKNLNEGKNYENELIIEAINEIKKNKEPIIIQSNTVDYDKKLFNAQIRRIKDNILMPCLCYFNNGIFIIFNNKKEVIQIINLQLDKNISCNLVSHTHKICFTSLTNKIVEIINMGNVIKFQNTLFFEIFIQSNEIMRKINQYFQDKRNKIIK